MKKINEIRKSREKKYNDYKDKINEIREHMNKINEILPDLMIAQDEMLDFMESAFDIQKDMEVPKPEEE